MYFFNWKKIALQCCVVFCRTTMRIGHNYTHIPSLPSSHHPPLGHHRTPGWGPCVIGQLPTSSLSISHVTVSSHFIISPPHLCLLLLPDYVPP